MTDHARIAGQLLEDAELRGGPAPRAADYDREWAALRVGLAAVYGLLDVSESIGSLVTLLEDCRSVLIDIRDEARKDREQRS